MTSPVVRPARPEDTFQIADIWHAGWHEAHASLVPLALTQQRTRASMRDRSTSHLSRTTVACAAGADDLLGFVMTLGAELYQLYTAPAARGTGVAQALMTEGERQLAAAGVTRAHLSCAIGNDRAARFYTKMGWHLAGTVTDELEIAPGHYTLDVWRFEKAL